MLAVGTDSQFRALCEVLDMPGAASDARFSTNPQRVIHRDALNTLLEDRIGQRERKSLLAELQARKIPAGAVRRLDEVLDDESAEPLLLQGQATDGTSISGLRTIAFDSDAISPPVRLGVPPEFNQDRQFVLSEVLGYNGDQIEGLKKASAVL